MMWTYYSPVLKMQLWLWPLIAFGLYALGLLTALSPLSMVSSFSVSGLSWLIGLSPLMLVRSKALVADTMLPARSDEKFMFFIIYFTLVVPLLVVATVGVLQSLAVAMIGADGVSEFTAVLNLRLKSFTLTHGLAYFSEILGVLATLFGVTAFTRNRALAGVGMNIGTGIVLGIIGGIFGIILAFTSGFIDGIKNIENQYPDEVVTSTQQLDALVTEMYNIPMLELIVIVTAVITFIGSLIFGCLTYRVLRNRQL